MHPLREDIEGIFSDKNPACAAGEHRRWVVKDERGRPVGRIAAFIDRKRHAELPDELPTGGIGFFEAVNDRRVADRLLDTAENWLRERGMTVVEGPINFGERDKFWGLLTRGWYRPVYQETYNPPYYRTWLEERGYTPHEQCLTMRGCVAEFPIDRLSRLAARIRERNGLYTKQVTKNNLREGADDFAAAYNAAFSHWPYFKPLSGDDVYPTFQQMKPILDKHLTCIAYNPEGRPIGLAGLIPDINCFLPGLGGQLNWKTLPRFLYRLKFQRERNCKGIAFGIARDYQRQGVFPLMIDAMWHSGNDHNPRVYRYVDMATIRGHNDLMVATCRQLNTEIHRVHIAYRKALVAGATWEPFQQLDVSEVAMGEVGFWANTAAQKG